MDAYLNKETEYGWYLCLDGGKIVGGMAGSFCVWFRVMANQIGPGCTFITRSCYFRLNI